MWPFSGNDLGFRANVAMASELLTTIEIFDQALIGVLTAGHMVGDE